MKKLLFMLVATLFVLPTLGMAASFYPGVGIGVSADGWTTFLVNGNLGIELSPMARLLIEGGYGRGGGANHFFAGGGVDIFFLPHLRIIVQPYAYGAGGYWHATDINGGFTRFGGGVELNLKAPVTPYAEIGAMIYFGGDNTQGAFNLLGGIRFSL